MPVVTRAMRRKALLQEENNEVNQNQETLPPPSPILPRDKVEDNLAPGPEPSSGAQAEETLVVAKKGRNAQKKKRKTRLDKARDSMFLYSKPKPHLTNSNGKESSPEAVAKNGPLPDTDADLVIPSPKCPKVQLLFTSMESKDTTVLCEQSHFLENLDQDNQDFQEAVTEEIKPVRNKKIRQVQISLLEELATPMRTGKVVTPRQIFEGQSPQLQQEPSSLSTYDITGLDELEENDGDKDYREMKEIPHWAKEDQDIVLGLAMMIPGAGDQWAEETPRIFPKVDPTLQMFPGAVTPEIPPSPPSHSVRRDSDQKSTNEEKSSPCPGVRRLYATI